MTTNSASSRFAPGCLFLFALPFAAVGTMVSVSLITLSYDQVRVFSWVETPCRILSTNLEVIHDEGTTYRIHATYRYEFAGREFQSERVELTTGSDNFGKFHHELHAELDRCWQTGQLYSCFVNPAAPEEAVLVRIARWEVVLLQTVGAIMFSGVGFGLIAVTFFQWPATGMPARIKLDTERWRVRGDWEEGLIRFSDRKTANILGGLTAGVAALSFPSLLVSSLALTRQPDSWAWLGLLPAIAANLCGWFGWKRWRRWMRFGESTFELAHVPGVVGGNLAGVIHVERRVDSPDGFKLQLSCRETVSDSDSNSSSLEWETGQLAERELEAESGTAIPVVLSIPEDARETNTDADANLITWTLTVRSASPSVDYRAQFEVPVFRMN